MKELLQAILAIALCLSVFFVLQRIKRRLLLPIRCGNGVRLSILVEASGRAHGLENTLRSAKMLQENCRSITFIVIKDEGLDEEPRQIAELFAAKNPLSILREAEYTGDTICSQKDSTFE